MKTKSITKQLRQAIAQAERGGMTRYRIAKNAGIRHTVLVRIADGVNRPRIDIAEKILSAIGKRLTIESK